jgi:hypothetical protein
MKFKSITNLFFVALVLFVLTCATASFAAEGGRLMVMRAANFGDRVSLSLSVDGKEVATLVEGHNYEGYLAPGRHIISATVVPNLVFSPVWQKEISVQSGRTYSFTAIWQGERMVLVAN